MKSKPIKIDWDALEDAFSTRDEELLYYLDRVTGHVVLDGEGEEEDFDDEESDDVPAPPAAPKPPMNDHLRLYVRPPDTATKIQWMRRFLDTATGLAPEVVDELRQALDAEDPGALIVDALARNSHERDEWYRYRAARIRELIGPWLEANGVVTTEPPPWS